MARWSLLLLFFAAGLDAQTPERPSHKPLDTGIGESGSPEEELARRLSGARTTKGKRDDLLLDKDLQDLAKSLMKDPEFLKSLKDRIPADELKALADRFRRGEQLPDLAKTPALEKLFREGLTSPKLDDKQRDLLKKWGERNPPTTPPEPGKATTPDVPPPSAPKAITPTATQPKQEVPAWLRERMDRWTADADKWAKTPAAKGWQEVVKRLAEGKQSGDNFVSGAMSRTRGLGSYLPKVGDYIPRISPPRLPSVRLPSFSSGPAGPPADVGSLLRAALVALVVVGIVMLLWRGAGWASAIAEARRRVWKLGPWPVAIDAVRTRAELVRAFEHLSLLLVGQAARTRHHLALARDIGQQPDIDPDQRRESADALATLYEQARYAPPVEDLSEGQLEQARRELRRLAGEAA